MIFVVSSRFHLGALTRVVMGIPRFLAESAVLRIVGVLV